MVEAPRVAVDVVVFTIRERALEVLLVERRIPPFEGAWALPGGFVRPDESLDAAARRELREETGLEVRYLEQLYTFGEVHRDPTRRVVSVTYFALVDRAGLEPIAGSDAQGVAFVPLAARPRLAFDHDRIVALALQRLRYKTEYAPVAFQLLPPTFTLPELQAVYEVILDRDLDRRNFRRKVQSLGILEAAGERPAEGRGRPAKLHRFRRDRFEDLGGGVVLAF
jgi:8-oxo-dGTP diphosphatase